MSPFLGIWRVPLICLGLVLLIFAIYGQTIGHGFVNFDDDLNIYRIPDIVSGISLHGVLWSFTHSQVSRWEPVTAISRQLDCQLYGLWAGGHHLTNVMLHAIGAVCLFLTLRTITGALWRSLFVAIIWAIYPLRVESVAWLSARADLLSGVFFFLTLLAYVGYTRKSTLARYLVVMLLFALGLMSKPMLVTLPFVLLLLDYWPLRRMGRMMIGTASQSKVKPLLVEKIPLFIMVLIASAATIVAQDGAIGSPDSIPISLRLENAAVAYVIYLGQMVRPSGLAPFYPLPQLGWPAWLVFSSVVFLAALTVIALLQVYRRPYLAVGWFWYLGMLLPVLGLIQSGNQSHADRYTYLPTIGILIALVWLLTDVFGKIKCGIALPFLFLAILIVLASLSWRQCVYWRDSFSLWSHAFACTRENAVSKNNLAWVLSTSPDPSQRDGRLALQLALQVQGASIERDPNLMETLAAAQAETGDYASALATARVALDRAQASGNESLIVSLMTEIILYGSGYPYRCSDSK